MSWRRAGIAMAIAIPIIMLFTFGLRRGDPRLIPSPLIDEPAPDFSLPVIAMKGPLPNGDDLTGDTVRLKDLEGQVIVLNFYASWCVPCRLEHRTLSRMARMYEGRGVKFLGVVYNDEPENVREYVRQLGGQSYPALMDPGQLVAIDYGLVGVPETFIIGKDGVVRKKIFSAVSEMDLAQSIDELLAQPAPAATATPTAGTTSGSEAEVTP